MRNSASFVLSVALVLGLVGASIPTATADHWPQPRDLLEMTWSGELDCDASAACPYVAIVDDPSFPDIPGAIPAPGTGGIVTVYAGAVSVTTFGQTITSAGTGTGDACDLYNGWSQCSVVAQTPISVGGIGGIPVCLQAKMLIVGLYPNQEIARVRPVYVPELGVCDNPADLFGMTASDISALLTPADIVTASA